MNFLLDETILAWRRWAKSCALPTFAPAHVLRSALCLKLHAYADTGAIVAAATTSIPEAMGTVRTWDYRYCWLRDAAFVVEALRQIVAARTRGEQFIGFLHAMSRRRVPLQPLYGIAGERRFARNTCFPGTSLPSFNGQGPGAHRQRRRRAATGTISTAELITVSPMTQARRSADRGRSAARFFRSVRSDSSGAGDRTRATRRYRDLGVSRRCRGTTRSSRDDVLRRRSIEVPTSRRSSANAELAARWASIAHDEPVPVVLARGLQHAARHVHASINSEAE